MFLPEPSQIPEILLVEDDPSLARSLAAVLTRYGYPVVVAAHGRAAMDVIARRRVALVISDIFMPEGDGLELLNFIRRLTPHPPLVAMSGAGDGRVGNMLKVAGALGAARILAKPFAPSQLLALVRELIGPPPAAS
jgi:DNA-binding response OmpR family regulator